MSYPSVNMILAERNIDSATARETELRDVIWEALGRDLPDGVKWVRDLAYAATESNEAVYRSEDPNSPLGRQITRVLGFDVPRSIAREKFAAEFGIPGLELAFFNCCGGGGGKIPGMLDISARMQIQFQDGTRASADC